MCIYIIYYVMDMIKCIQVQDLYNLFPDVFYQHHLQ